MQESGEDHLVESQGRIYILNGIRDIVHRLESPSTLEELLEQMKNRKGYFYERRLIDHPDLKWAKIDPQAMDTCSGEYISYHPRVFPQVSDVVLPRQRRLLSKDLVAAYRIFFWLGRLEGFAP